MGLGGCGLPARWRPLGFALHVRDDDETRPPHPPHEPLRVDRQVLDNTPIGPDAAVAPAWGLGGERLKARASDGIARGELKRSPSFQPSRSALFVALAAECPNEPLASGVLLCRQGVLRGVLLDCQGMGRMCPQLVPPLVIRRLAALVFGANRRHGLACEAREHEQGGGFGLPWPSVQGGPPWVSATGYAVPKPHVLRGCSIDPLWFELLRDPLAELPNVRSAALCLMHCSLRFSTHWTITPLTRQVSLVQTCARAASVSGSQKVMSMAR